MKYISRFDNSALIAGRFFSYESTIFFICIYGWIIAGSLIEILMSSIQLAIYGFNWDIFFIVIFSELANFLILAAVLLLGFWLWDLYWSRRIGRSTDFHEDDYLKLKMCVRDNQVLSRLISRNIVKCMYGDFGVSAHIQGIFKNTIVVSEGLLVLLLQRNRAALCILSHEFAHVLAKDRFSMAVVSIVLLSLFMSIISAPLLLSGVLIRLIILGATCIVVVYFIRRREVTADFIASLIYGDTEEYQAHLRTFVDKGHVIFHPSKNARLSALEAPSTATKPSALIYVYVSVILLVLFGSYLDYGAIILITFLSIGVVYELCKPRLRRKLIAQYDLRI